MKKRMNKFVPYLLGTCLLAVVACGSDDDDNGSGAGGGGTTGGNPPQQEETLGTYRANLTAIPLNTSVSGNPSGTFEMVIEGDEVTAKMDMKDVPAGIIHAQHIAIGDSCPTEANDIGIPGIAEKDNFIDVIEGATSYKAFLIPLDGDLEDQDDGKQGFPRAKADGTYQYTKTASLSRMIADLQDADIDLEDGLTKLEGSDLALEGKVVVVHGVNESADLPDTVKTIGDYRSHQSLPIACGVIERVQEETTGETTTGETTTGETTTGETTTGETTTGETTTGETTTGQTATTN